MCQITLEEAGMPRHRKSLVEYDVKALKHASEYISEAAYRDLCGPIHSLAWPNKNLRVEYIELAKRHLGLA